MTGLTTVQLNPPYLILIGAEDDATYAKTGLGIVHWRPELVAGQLRFPGCTVDMGVPDMTVAEAAQIGVGNMTGTSLGMAPAFVVAQLCDFVDIDGPLLLKYDHPNGMSYHNGVVDVFQPSLWG